MGSEATIDCVEFEGRHYVSLDDIIELAKVNSDRQLVQGNLAGAFAMDDLVKCLLEW